ncbi:Retrotransposon gag domain [Lasallia pustulata]|uniref:Retrotransposon gag domain n=1 Tax=Lasallia pustulata TaxID=136370 RepID=A0A1W5D3B4_9LECA|nr:Retrotransposon gag domain [Lasallia pustulata]
MGHATIKLFSGQRDGKEDPGEYLKDIEFAYINDYAGSPAAVKEDDHKSKTSKILFRQHLREGAATWYGDLPKDTKNDWEKLKKEFKAEFKFEDNHKMETFILWQRVSSLSQGEDKPIMAYIYRADDLARKLPAALATLGFNVVRGMEDDTQRCRVTFECAKEQDCDFQKVKKFIVAAYQVIGQNGPFETTQEGTTGSSGAAKGSTLTWEDWNQQILPSILQGMRALSTQQETILNTLANTGTRPQPVLNARGSYGIVDDWFKHSGITIGPKAETPTQQSQVKCLLYTWKDCFAVTVREIQPTDLIEHSIDLLPYSKPVRSKLPHYTPREREFSNRIFPELEEAGIVARMSSNWAAQTIFPPKKKGSDQLRVVHNFIPVNKCTIKSEYPMHRLEEVLDVLIKSRFSCYFSTDASNSYWAVPIKAGDEYKAGIITPHGQYAYRRMGQGLKGAPHTYSQFTDLVFGPIPQNDVSGEPQMDTIIGNHGNTAMALFMDDYAASATDFDSLYNFLADFFFPRAAFGPIYLNPKKTVVFGINLDLLGFTGGAGTIRPSIKHRDKVMNWPIPTNRQELDAFVYLTPFLKNFIAGQASHVLTLKKAYLEQVPAEPVKPKNRPEIEACDEDLTKPARGERYRPYQNI